MQEQKVEAVCYCQIFSGLSYFLSNPFSFVCVIILIIVFVVFTADITAKLRMIYKQRNLLSFVLVSIVELAQETFSVLVNVSSC